MARPRWVPPPVTIATRPLMSNMSWIEGGASSGSASAEACCAATAGGGLSLRLGWGVRWVRSALSRREEALAIGSCDAQEGTWC